MDEGKNRQIIVMAIIVIVLLAIIGYALGGVRGISGIAGFLKWAVIGVLIVGIAFYAVWFLFIRKVRDDRVALNVQNIIHQAKLTKPETIGDLYISGDMQHPQVKLGKIVGYCRVQNVKGSEEDVFVWKKAGFPFSMLEEPKVLRVAPEQHSDMVGDIVVQGISVVQHGGFLYINTDHLDIGMIDATIKTEVIRKFAIDVLSDIKIISDMAVGINPEHQKLLESKSLLKLPGTSNMVQGQQSYEEQVRAQQGGR